MMANLFPISLCLLVLAMVVTALARQYDIDWLNVLGALFALIGAGTMIVFMITACCEDTKYEAVINGEYVKYTKCYKEHGQNVCEGAFNSKVIVEDYWKK